MNKPHVHRDVMIHFANGGEVQSRMAGYEEWGDSKKPQFHLDWQYRIKPEREYPVTSLSDGKLDNIYNSFLNTSGNTLRMFANEIIKQHIIDTEGK